MEYIVFVGISFFASVIGCICGIGGGVLIKPVMDAFQLYPVSTVSFMSGCIVLSMTAYSVLKSVVSHDSKIEKGVSTWLGSGAALGGIAGKQIFEAVRAAASDPNAVGAVQSVALLLVTVATVVFTLNKSRMKTRNVHTPVPCAIIGLSLGLISAFLGIGGGPLNLVVLYYFASMDTKTAAQNSLYIILLSQLASLIYSIIGGTVPELPVLLFIMMVLCGILGGVVGRRINKRINAGTVNRLFISLMFVIMLICCYNFTQYAGVLFT